MPTTDQRLAVCAKPENQPHVMYQTWKELLFLHWEFPREQIQATLPPGLTVDTFEGRAFVGLVPFYMRGIRPRFCPPVPGISNFLELNVRTYVYDEQGRPGVWFYSLDCNQRLAVSVARRFFHLPYFHAKMTAPTGGKAIDYGCDRKGFESKTSITYEAGASLPAPEPGSLEFFLLERYRLFSHDPKAGRLFSGQVHHSPYPTHEAIYEIHHEGSLRLAGFDTQGRAPAHAIMSRGVCVKVYALERVPEVFESRLAGHSRR
jgi:uncharacterized protein YqjF (DUF2071 family)